MWTLIGIMVLATLLLAAWPYAQHIRHPETRPLAAYLIFVTIISAALAGGIALSSALVLLLAPPGEMLGPVPIVGCWLAALSAGVLLGRHILAQPPLRPPL